MKLEYLASRGNRVFVINADITGNILQCNVLFVSENVPHRNTISASGRSFTVELPEECTMKPVPTLLTGDVELAIVD